MAIKVEKQLKQKGTVQQSQSLGVSIHQKPNWKANTMGGPSHLNKKGKVEYLKKKKDTSIVVKGNKEKKTIRRKNKKTKRESHL